ncbi:U2 snRNP-associated SURP motif-containing protein-like, partial [Trifolium medium]|nr:U2 snRNP-associated SURP motif-containing protein-like [Trifolium medium]
WIPPALPIAKSPEHDKESGSTHAAGRSRRVEPERTLTDAQRDEFEDMLRALTLERSQIKGAMGFSLDNADAAGEIAYLFPATSLIQRRFHSKPENTTYFSCAILSNMLLASSAITCYLV